jgi:anti-sigma B factor antagonist
MPGDAPDAPERSRPTELFEVGQLSISSERDGDVHVIGLFGELDLATADSVEQELRAVEATDASSIVVDLSGLTFMDSTGLRLVWQAEARSRADANRLTLLRGPRAVQRVFEISGIAGTLPFAD